MWRWIEMWRWTRVDGAEIIRGEGNRRAWPQRLRGSAVPLARYAQFARDKIKSKDVTMSKRSCLG